jgi:hypothetical protein
VCSTYSPSSSSSSSRRPAASTTSVWQVQLQGGGTRRRRRWRAGGTAAPAALGPAPVCHPAQPPTCAVALQLVKEAGALFPLHLALCRSPRRPLAALLLYLPPVAPHLLRPQDLLDLNAGARVRGLRRSCGAQLRHSATEPLARPLPPAPGPLPAATPPAPGGSHCPHTRMPPSEHAGPSMHWCKRRLARPGSSTR